MENAFRIKLSNFSTSNLVYSRVIFKTINSYFVFTWPSLEPFHSPIAYNETNPHWKGVEHIFSYFPGGGGGGGIKSEYFKKQFVNIQIFAKKKLQKDTLIGFATLDLYSILFGPKEFHLTLKNDKEMVTGKVQFMIEVDYTTKTTIIIEDFTCQFYDLNSKYNLFITSSCDGSDDLKHTSVQYNTNKAYWLTLTKLNTFVNLHGFIHRVITLKVNSKHEGKHHQLITSVDLKLEHFLTTKDHKSIYFSLPIHSSSSPSHTASSSLSEEDKQSVIIGKLDGTIKYINIPYPSQMEGGYYLDGTIYSPIPILLDPSFLSSFTIVDLKAALYQLAEGEERMIKRVPDIFTSQILSLLSTLPKYEDYTSSSPSPPSSSSSLSSSSSPSLGSDDDYHDELNRVLKQIRRFLRGSEMKKQSFLGCSGVVVIRNLLRRHFVISSSLSVDNNDINSASSSSSSHRGNEGDDRHHIIRDQNYQLISEILYLSLKEEKKHQVMLVDQDFYDVKLILNSLMIITNPFYSCKIIYLFATRDSISQIKLRSFGAIQKLFKLFESSSSLSHSPTPPTSDIIISHNCDTEGSGGKVQPINNYKYIEVILETILSLLHDTPPDEIYLNEMMTSSIQKKLISLIHIKLRVGELAKQIFQTALHYNDNPPPPPPPPHINNGDDNTPPISNLFYSIFSEQQNAIIIRAKSSSSLPPHGSGRGGECEGDESFASSSLIFYNGEEMEIVKIVASVLENEQSSSSSSSSSGDISSILQLQPHHPSLLVYFFTQTILKSHFSSSSSQLISSSSIYEEREEVEHNIITIYRAIFRSHNNRAYYSELLRYITIPSSSPVSTNNDDNNRGARFSIIYRYYHHHHNDGSNRGEGEVDWIILRWNLRLFYELLLFFASNDDDNNDNNIEAVLISIFLESFPSILSLVFSPSPQSNNAMIDTSGNNNGGGENIIIINDGEILSIVSQILKMIANRIKSEDELHRYLQLLLQILSKSTNHAVVIIFLDLLSSLFTLHRSSLLPTIMNINTTTTTTTTTIVGDDSSSSSSNNNKRAMNITSLSAFTEVVEFIISLSFSHSSTSTSTSSSSPLSEEERSREECVTSKAFHVLQLLLYSSSSSSSSSSSNHKTKQTHHHHVEQNHIFKSLLTILQSRLSQIGHHNDDNDNDNEENNNMRMRMRMTSYYHVIYLLIPIVPLNYHRRILFHLLLSQLTSIIPPITSTHDDDNIDDTMMEVNIKMKMEIILTYVKEVISHIHPTSHFCILRSLLVCYSALLCISYPPHIIDNANNDNNDNNVDDSSNDNDGRRKIDYQLYSAFAVISSSSSSSVYHHMIKTIVRDMIAYLISKHSHSLFPHHDHYHHHHVSGSGDNNNGDNNDDQNECKRLYLQLFKSVIQHTGEGNGGSDNQRGVPEIKRDNKEEIEILFKISRLEVFRKDDVIMINDGDNADDGDDCIITSCLVYLNHPFVSLTNKAKLVELIIPSLFSSSPSSSSSSSSPPTSIKVMRSFSDVLFTLLLSSLSSSCKEGRHDDEGDDEDEEAIQKLQRQTHLAICDAMKEVKLWSLLLPLIQSAIEKALITSNHLILHSMIDLLTSTLFHLFTSPPHHPHQQVEISGGGGGGGGGEGGRKDMKMNTKMMMIPFEFFEEFNLIVLFMITFDTQISESLRSKVEYLISFILHRSSSQTLHFRSSYSPSILFTPILSQLSLLSSHPRNVQLNHDDNNNDNNNDDDNNNEEIKKKKSEEYNHQQRVESLIYELLCKLPPQYVEIFSTYLSMIEEVGMRSYPLPICKLCFHAIANLIRLPISSLLQLPPSAIPISHLMEMMRKGEVEITRSVWQIIRGIFFDPKKQSEFLDIRGFHILANEIAYLHSQLSLSDYHLSALDEILQFLVGASKLNHLHDPIMEDGVIEEVMRIIPQQQNERIILPCLAFIYFISVNPNARAEIIDTAEVDTIATFYDSPSTNPKIKKAAEECYLKLGGCLEKCSIASSKNLTFQPYYICYTCGLNGPGICQNCAMFCHRNHQLSGVMQGVMRCNCGHSFFCVIKDRFNLRSKLPLQLCNILFSGREGVIQEGWICYTCFVDGQRLICKTCSMICHVGHQVVYGSNFGPLKFVCGCGEKQGTVCLCRTPPSIKPNSLPRRRRNLIPNNNNDNGGGGGGGVNFSVLLNNDCKAELLTERKEKEDEEMKKKMMISEQEDNSCIICMENSKNAMFYKCGHIATCMDCACTLKQRGDVCVVCRKKIDEVVQIFLS